MTNVSIEDSGADEGLIPSSAAAHAAMAGEEGSGGKAEFGHIYNEPDPASYYQILGAYDYRIPEYGANVVSRLLKARSDDGCDHGDRLPTVLDVCCSYGVGGALLTTDLDLDDLYAHYGGAGPDQAGVVSARADRAWFADHRRADAARVIGLDVAENAVKFGVETGVMAEGIVADLESKHTSSELAAVGAVDVIMCTGGVGYITERTFDHLLTAIPNQPWLAIFCLRTYDFSPIAQVLDRHGLSTERARATFPQRRFVDGAEQDWAIAEVLGQGLDPTGKEDEGVYHANLYVSRGPEDVRRQPLTELFPDLGDRRTGSNDPVCG